MKKTFSLLLTLSLFALLLYGCAKPADLSDSSSPSDTPSVSNPQPSAEESESLRLLKEMMALDYPTMSVSDFNQSVQDIAAKEDMSIFEVISNIYDEGEVVDKNGAFITILLPDDTELRDFLETTLNYSSQEIFKEPVHMAATAYITTANLTAEELRKKELSMTDVAWHDYFEGIVQDIELYTTLFYEIEFEVFEPETLLVSVRDARINAVQSDVEAFLLSMTPEEINAGDLQARIESKLNEISEEYSDDQVKISCRIQSLESMPIV